MEMETNMKNTEKNLKKQILMASPAMTSKEKKVAQFFSESLHKIPAYTMQEIAQRLETSSTIILKTTEKIGFASFSDLKKAIIESLPKEPSITEKIMNTLARTKQDSLESIYLDSVEEDICYLSLLKENWNRSRIDETVDILHKAQTIYLLGYGISEALVIFLKFRLERLGKKAKVLHRMGYYLAGELAPLEKKDVLLTFAFQSPAQEIVGALKYANSIGTPTIALTNGPESPLAKYADTVVPAKRGPNRTLHSLALPITICHLITLGLLNKAEEQAKKTGKTMEGILDLFSQE